MVPPGRLLRRVNKDHQRYSDLQEETSCRALLSRGNRQYLRPLLVLKRTFVHTNVGGRKADLPREEGSQPEGKVNATTNMQDST